MPSSRLPAVGWCPRPWWRASSAFASSIPSASPATTAPGQGDLKALKGVSAEVAKLGGGSGKGLLIVDDLVDTGKTGRLVRSMMPDAHFAAVYAKPQGKPLVDTLFCGSVAGHLDSLSLGYRVVVPAADPSVTGGAIKTGYSVMSGQRVCIWPIRRTSVAGYGTYGAVRIGRGPCPDRHFSRSGLRRRCCHGRRHRHRQPDPRRLRRARRLWPCQRPSSSQSKPFPDGALAGAGAGHRGRRHGVRPRRQRRRSARPVGVPRALHPRRDLPGAAGRDVGGAHPFAGRSSIHH